METLQQFDLPIGLLLLTTGLYLLINRKKYITAREEKVHRREISKTKAQKSQRLQNATTFILVSIGAVLVGLKFASL